VIAGLFTPASSSSFLKQFYDRYLFQGRLLKDLPDLASGPQIVLNATDMRTGSEWVFSKQVAGDDDMGYVSFQNLSISAAVASSAFPPVLAPFTLDVDPREWHGSTWSPVDQTNMQARAKRLVWEKGFPEELAARVAMAFDDPSVLAVQAALGDPQSLVRQEEGREILLEDGGVSDNASWPECFMAPQFFVSLAAVPENLVTPVRRNWLSVGLRTTDLLDARAEQGTMYFYTLRIGYV
jgi:predicted acylesterase/phospholipase RssA